MTKPQAIGRMIGAALLLHLAGGIRTAGADQFTWDNGYGDGEWTNDLNWGFTNPGYPDDAGDVALMQQNGPDGTIHLGAPVTVSTLRTGTDLTYTVHDFRFTGAPLTATSIQILSPDVTFTFDNEVVLPAAGTAIIGSHGGSTNVFNGRVWCNNANGLRLDRYGTGGIAAYRFAASNTLAVSEYFTVGYNGNDRTEIILDTAFPFGQAHLALNADPPDSFLSLNTNVMVFGEFSCGPQTNFSVRVHQGDADRTIEFRDMLRGGSAKGAIRLGNAADDGAGKVLLRHKPDPAIASDANGFHIIVDGVAGSVVELDSSLLSDPTTLNVSSNNNGVGLIRGGATVRKVGPGIATFFFVNQEYTGGTDIREGTVRIQNAPGGLPDTGAVTLWSGTLLHLRTAGDTLGTLAGEGTVDLGNIYTLTLLEGLSPGTNCVGTLTIDNNGSVTLGSAAESVFDLGPLAEPHDQVLLDDKVTLTLGGALTIRDTAGPLEVGSYVLFKNRLATGSIGGGFSATNLPPRVEGFVDTSTKDVILHITAIPPKGSLLLLR